MPEEMIPKTTEEMLPPNSKIKQPQAQKPKPTPSKTQPLKNSNTNSSPPQQRIEYTDKPIKKVKPEYKYIDKKSLAQILKEILPKHLIPTENTAKILGIVFMAVVILALVQFPIKEFLSGDLSIVVKVGIPWTFLEFGIIELGQSPLNWTYFILDLIIYLVASYIIDVLINIILDIKIIKSKEDKLKIPVVYKDLKPTLADRTTQKIFKK